MVLQPRCIAPKSDSSNTEQGYFLYVHPKLNSLSIVRYKQLTSMQRPQTLTLLLRKPQEKRVCTLLASANLHYVVRCGARVASWVNMPDSRHSIKAMEWRKRSTHNAIAKRSLRMVLTKSTTKYPERLSLTRWHRRSATWA